MDRRRFLKSTGLLAGWLGAGGLLSACGDGSAIPDGEATWNLVPGGYPELLVGEQRRFAFGLLTLDNERVSDPDVEVYTREVGGEVLGGPFTADFHADAGGGLGVYVARLDAERTGHLEVVAVSGGDHGAAAVNVVEPADSAVPVPGDEAVVTATPTTAEALGYGELCTRQPDCPMHDVSLDQALAAGRPVVLMFATPAYCQTAMCGPGVDTMLEVRDSRDWGELAFVHCEIFTDEGVTVGEPVRHWDLPSEPWLFTIDRDGAVAARVDGPMIRDELAALAEAVA